MQKTDDKLAAQLVRRHFVRLLLGDSVFLLPLHHVNCRALVVLAAIVGRADRGNVDDRKALMANALLNEADRLLDMIRASPGGIARACPIGKTRNIKRAVEVSVGRGRAIIAARRGGRILAACHAVDFVVEHDDGQADISPCRVNDR